MRQCSGKTKVITNRIAHLITTKGVYPAGIMGVTLTNKAAGEIREGVNKHLVDVSLAATLHSFCVCLLGRDGDAIQFG